jgi:hypothetical protein
MRILFLNTFLLLGLLFFNSNLEAQRPASPLEPQTPPKQMELGLLIGLGNNWESGSYNSGLYLLKCKKCTFEDGNNIGITAGIVFNRDFNEYFQWGASLLYITKNIESSFKITEMVTVESGTYSEDRPIPFNYKASFEVGMLSIQPHLTFSPYPFLFMRLGFGASIITSANIIHTKELTKFYDVLSNGLPVSLIIDENGKDIRIQEIENSEIPGINRFQLSLEPAFGFNFELASQIYLSPLFQYSIPLTQISNIQKDFNINNWRISLELRLALKMRN